jgi:hypothetical protein
MSQNTFSVVSLAQKSSIFLEIPNNSMNKNLHLQKHNPNKKKKKKKKTWFISWGYLRASNGKNRSNSESTPPPPPPPPQKKKKKSGKGTGLSKKFHLEKKEWQVNTDQRSVNCQSVERERERAKKEKLQLRVFCDVVNVVVC